MTTFRFEIYFRDVGGLEHRDILQNSPETRHKNAMQKKPRLLPFLGVSVLYHVLLTLLFRSFNSF